MPPGYAGIIGGVAVEGPSTSLQPLPRVLTGSVEQLGLALVNTVSDKVTLRIGDPVAKLTLVACSASPSGAVWIILAAALLGVVYVLAMNVHATRHLPLATDSADGPHHTTPGTPNAPSRTPTDIRPVAQIAQIRHQQYADLIQRCLHAKQRDAPVCQQLATLHRTVHDLHSQEDVLPTKERDQDAFSDRPESS